MAMEYKRLGSTDLEISRIGFGCWAIGGHGYGRVDDQESIKTIQKALDLGINFFDTADVYGFGHSEEILSKALGSQKDRVVIATKFGVNWDESGRIFYDCSPRRAKEALEGSLRRLKIDSIPLYQLHWYDNATPLSETLQILTGFQEAGKIRHIGFSNFPLSLLVEISKNYRIESLQNPYNISQRNLEKETSRWSDILNISILVYNVLARGLFSGKFDSHAKFVEGDTRIKDENYLGKQFTNNMLLVEKIKELGSFHNKTAAQVAIRWVLDNKNVTCALIGATNQRQVEENVGALGWNLSSEDYDYIVKKTDEILYGSHSNER